MDKKWVVITFFPEGFYNTSTYDTMEEAYEVYCSSINLRSKGLFDKRRRYALVLEGSELPIKGYKPGEMATGAPYEEAK